MRQQEELSILVVDDMKFNCEFIRRVLGNAGYSDIRVARSALDALEQLQQRRVDVLLADWVMPEMDGLTLTNRVRQLDEEANHYTCILLLTARDDMDSVIEAFERGVDDYLTKPPNPQELAARIHAAGRIAIMHNNLLDAMAGMERQYHQYVTIDALTGLGNRLEALRRLDEWLRLVDSRGGGICCGVLRIHRAEALRQQYGNAGYDELLTLAAKRLKRAVRPNDLVARLDETDFAIGMYYADEELIKVRNLKRILQGMNMRPLKSSLGYVSLTGALGMSCNRAGEPLISADELLGRAAERVAVSIKTGCSEVGV